MVPAGRIRVFNRMGSPFGEKEKGGDHSEEEASMPAQALVGEHKNWKKSCS